MKEDFCQATLDYRKELWKEAKRLREKSKIAYLQYRSILVKRKDNTGQCLVKIWKNNSLQTKLRWLLTQTSNRCHIILLQWMIIFLILKAIQILIFIVIFHLLTQNNINPNEIREGFKRLCKNDFSALYVNIRTINKSFAKFKNFYSKLNCTFSVICFSETWATDNSISNGYNFQIENYTPYYIRQENLAEGED